VKSWRTGHRYCQRWPSRQAMAAIRAKVRAISAPRARLKWPIQKIVGELNPVLRGWANYFRWGNSGKKFGQIESYVIQRLALFDSKKHQRKGRRWTEVHTRAWVWVWGLGVYRLSGTIRYVLPATARP
jgi:RNA-directed DNA polymerase